jgi:HAE1 family hydrophobic/amphiphilic exporter-1
LCGFFIPKNPNDEPASKLLKRINPKAKITSDNEHYENLPFDVPQKRQNSMLLIFSIYDAEDKYNIEFLENYANINLIPEIKRVKGVGDANVMGQDYSMRIWLKPDIMAQYKLNPTDVSNALAEQNIEAAPGQFGERGNQTYQYTIRYKGRLQQIEEFENIVIKALPNGQVLRLGEIANVELGRLAYTFNNRVNGQ